MNRFSVRMILAALVLVLAGCTTVYTPRYGAHGVYYEDPAPRYAGSYGYDRSYSGAWAANPVYYPYWSLDYFYFSQYYHPYSVVVGHWDPYYYPYPGWRYGGYHRSRPGLSVSLSFGDPWWGYPWHGHGYRWQPAHYGFFGGVGYSRGWHDGYGRGWYDGYRYDRYADHGHAAYRANDRLRMLQRRESEASRDVLLARRDGRIGGSTLRGEQPMQRTQVLQQKRGTSVPASRSGGLTRMERRADVAPERASTPRSSIRSSNPSRIERQRASRSELRRPVQRASQPQRRIEPPSRFQDRASLRSSRPAVQPSPARPSVQSRQERTRSAVRASSRPAYVAPPVRSNRREVVPSDRGIRLPAPRAAR
ncbi:hypothetical protein HFP89_08875, partial [Wenzhouxiangella sp. XN79A]|nr:hypothetical protein [Wenzhouxiangella sp. XN79A]